jgi:hypothetical protein
MRKIVVTEFMSLDGVVENPLITIFAQAAAESQLI